jgi:hypothetical protein
MDVTVDSGRQVLCLAKLKQLDANDNFINLTFSIDSPCTDLEVRVWVSETSDLQVSMLTIAPYSDSLVLTNDYAAPELNDATVPEMVPTEPIAIAMLSTTSLTPAELVPDISIVTMMINSDATINDTAAHASDSSTQSTLTQTRNSDRRQTITSAKAQPPAKAKRRRTR